ncbi:Emerin-like protein 1 [Frankliniella fusca]|uniref:Emerin-like protein 1 n=1 Tax=Frankliniella fusca TaxID=407009 RepID=A0AAE1LQY2_9NEOP|nr:Emerin-like protein 1 [Frankliniella fusca]
MSLNEENVLQQVKGLPDLELREKLTSLGVDVGPITGTTRNLYEKKLVRLLTGTRSEFSDDSSPTVKSSPKSSPPKSPPKSPTVVTKGNKASPAGSDFADGIQLSEPLTSSYAPLNDSTVNLIRPRKPLSRVMIEEPATSYDDSPYPVRKPLSRTVETSVRRTSTPRQNTPFPAANAQFRKTDSAGTLTDHVIKFALFGAVMLVIVYFILNQDAGNALEQRH